MAKQLIIHAGFHKTGTTSLQEALSANRKILLSKGIHYPHMGSEAHHRAALAISGRIWGWKKRGGSATPIKEWSSLAKQINRSRKNVVISSEFFCEASLEQIQRIKSDIKTSDIKVVFTLRPLVKLLASSYQQYLKYGIKPTYEEWLHSVLDIPGISKMTPTFWKRHMHGEVIENWVSVFGKDNVEIIVVDERKPEFLFESFNSLLGLEESVLKAQESGSNRSLTVEEIDLLIEINRNFPETRTWADYEIFIRDGAIKYLTDHVAAPLGARKLLTPEWAVIKAQEISCLNVEGIKRSGVRIIGDIESFGSATVPIGTNQPNTQISIETAASALMALDQSVVQKLPWRTLVIEMKRKIKKVLSRPLIEMKRKIKKLFCYAR